MSFDVPMMFIPLEWDGNHARIPIRTVHVTPTNNHEVFHYLILLHQIAFFLLPEGHRHLRFPSRASRTRSQTRPVSVKIASPNHAITYACNPAHNSQGSCAS